MGLLGGSWEVITGVISPLILVIITVTLLITPLITTHEPPSRDDKSCGPLRSVRGLLGLVRPQGAFPERPINTPF